MVERWREVFPHPHPHLHRKAWEYGYLIQALWERGFLEAGRRGLGFGVGIEYAPSFFARYGIDTTATDQPPEQAADWAATRQHAASLEALHYPHLCDRETFSARVRLRYLDMNHIPADLEGFDFVWSLGSLEHLGSLANSNRFILESLRCLRPGGVAVHTTEYSIYPEEPVTTGGTIYYDRREILKLAEEVGRHGHRMECDDFALGSHPLNYWMDFPPYCTGRNIHLRLFANDVLATSCGIVIHKGPPSAPPEA